jgi:hypothetical protein
MSEYDTKTYDPDQVLTVGNNVLNLIELHQRQQHTMLELVLSLAQRMTFAPTMSITKPVFGHYIMLTAKPLVLLYPRWQLPNLRSWVHGVREGDKPITVAVMFPIMDEKNEEQWLGIARKTIVRTKLQRTTAMRLAEVCDLAH